MPVEPPLVFVKGNNEMIVLFMCGTRSIFSIDKRFDSNYPYPPQWQ